MKFIVLLTSFLVLSSCLQEEENNQLEPKDWSMDHSVDFNKEIHEREELAIEIYLANPDAYKKEEEMKEDTTV